jgi:DNA-binding NtrC family response regulator
MKKIVIIDDEKDILDTLKRFLTRSGKLEIDCFLNPKEALTHIKSGKYDLVLTDIMMPQMNGMDVLKIIKNESPETKVIMMTAYSTIDKTIEANQVGAEEYVTKPFVSLRDVENKVLDLLGL